MRFSEAAKRFLLGCLAVFLGFGIGGAEAASGGEPLDLRQRGIALDPSNPSKTEFGSLTFLGGLELSSDHPRFGGLSSIVLRNGGRLLLAVSDRGAWVSFEPILEKGRLAGVRRAAIAPMRSLSGEPVAGRERDAEAVVALDSGAVLVGFEREHRIWRYDLAPEAPLRSIYQAKPVPMPVPGGVRRASRNSGIEAMTALPNGGVLALIETPLGHRNAIPGWVMSNRGVYALTYRKTPQFRVTDLALLPDGDLLLLERRPSPMFGGPSARLSRLDSRELRPGAKLESQEIAALEGKLNLENLEGVAVDRTEKGEVLIYLVSDDNFDPRQRTLLLLFRLEDGFKMAEAARRR